MRPFRDDALSPPPPPPTAGGGGPEDPSSAEDHAHWDAAEEASELLREQRFKEALVELRGVLEKDARNPYALYFLGISLYETGRLEPARDAYRACVRVAPRHLGARVGLAHVLRALGDYRGALQEGMQALSVAPGDADALYAVGMAYYGRGDETAARRFFHAFLEASPEYESAEEVKLLLEQMGERPS
jgi:Flp pilus assembly protein TadD